MLQRFRVFIVAVAVFAAAGYALYRHPPIKAVARGEIGMRLNRLTGSVDEWRDANVVVVPGVHELRIFSLRDRVYRPVDAARADSPAPFQSVEGLSLGVDVAVRYTLDAARLRVVWNTLPDGLGHDLVEPTVQGVMYKVFARYTVREIFSTKRPRSSRRSRRS